MLHLQYLPNVAYCHVLVVYFIFNASVLEASRFYYAEILSCPAQADLGSISSEIKNLQEQSMSMGIKLKNRKVYLFTYDLNVW